MKKLSFIFFLVLISCLNNKRGELFISLHEYQIRQPINKNDYGKIVTNEKRVIYVNKKAIINSDDFYDFRPFKNINNQLFSAEISLQGSSANNWRRLALASNNHHFALFINSQFQKITLCQTTNSLSSIKVYLDYNKEDMDTIIQSVNQDLRNR